MIHAQREGNQGLPQGGIPPAQQGCVGLNGLILKGLRGTLLALASTLAIGNKFNGQQRLCHRLVMELSGQPQPSSEHEVDHINGVRSDNRIENLRWVRVRETCRTKRFQMKPDTAGS